jgi:hypothetical protein
LLQALLDLWPDIVGFGIGFAVIGRYCAAHHRFVALVQDGQAGNKAPFEAETRSRRSAESRLSAGERERNGTRQMRLSHGRVRLIC